MAAVGRQLLIALPLAHAGHWAVDLLYVTPLLIVVAVLAYASIKDRRRARREDGEERRPPAES